MQPGTWLDVMESHERRQGLDSMMAASSSRNTTYQVESMGTAADQNGLDGTFVIGRT